jgi:hypothetical protein
MGQAWETVGFTVLNPGSTETAVTFATGDSGTVRFFNTTARARLIQAGRQGAAEGYLQILSPRLHDNVIGLRFRCVETPSVFNMPPESAQELAPSDVLTVNMTGGTAEHESGYLTIYYSDLPDTAQHLAMWSDIQSHISHLHMVEVDFTDSSTAGTWVDTAFNATQDQFKANRWYAVLGYTTDVSLTAIGVKGTMTNYLRFCGPGVTATDDTANWFIDIGRQHNLPSIPVWNANNKAATYLSSIGVGAGTATKAVLNMALLDESYQG